MQVAMHYTILVYPFRHAIEPGERSTRLRQLSSRWQPWWRRLDEDADEDALATALDDTHFFVPYVRQLIFPETAHLPNTVGPVQQAEARKLAALPAHDLAKQLHRNGMVRLTHDLTELSGCSPLTFEFKRTTAGGDVIEDFSTKMSICWVDVALFPQEVGFLAIKVKIEEEPLHVNRLVDSLYYLRLVQPPRLGWELARWKAQSDARSFAFTNQNLIDFLLQGLTEEQKHVDSTLGEYITRIESGAPVQSYASTEEGQVYGQAFREFTYVCLDESKGDESIGTGGEVLAAIADKTGQPSDRAKFLSTPSDQALYELATCTQLSDPAWEPHPEGLARLLEKGYIALWSNWQGLALHDNVTFMGKGRSRFTLDGLPHNVESDYFHLYLFTLYQRVRLNWLSGELMTRAANLHREIEDAHDMWDKFIIFRNHYWLAEVTFKPQGIELYHRYRRALGVPETFEHFRREMKDLQQYYERKSDQRIESLLNFIALVALPIEVVVHLFANRLGEEGIEWQMLEWAVLGIVFVVAVYMLWIRYLSAFKLTLWAKRNWRKLTGR
jgi:hypothetical protein